MGPEWSDPRTIQHWPGKLGHEIRNKVETSVSYDDNTGDLATWGFLSNPDDERFEYNSFFKLHLDPNHRVSSKGASSPLCQTKSEADILLGSGAGSAVIGRCTKVVSGLPSLSVPVYYEAF